LNIVVVINNVNVIIVGNVNNGWQLLNVGKYNGVLLCVIMCMYIMSVIQCKW